MSTPKDKPILVVDDDREMCRTLEVGLTRRGFDVEWRTNAEEAFAALEQMEVGAVVTDLRLRGDSGLSLCERIVANRPDIPVVVITAFGSMDAAIDAIRAGAYDFITKPLEVDFLALALERAARHRALQDEVKLLRQRLADATRFGELLGTSEAMRRLYDLLERIADSDASVLITGETGTGKELVARALHDRSARRDRPFIALNCAAMPEALLESELFGHVRGAFTDARSDHTGLLVRVQGGTLFLDEIGDMPVSLQPKLLRALQERVVRPVGGSAEIEFDARVIAATNQDLEALVEQQGFRADLYFRLNVLPVDLPPLRARTGDVLLLAQHFLQLCAARSGKSVSGISSPAADKLMGYSWPGNVRELQNCIERAVALTRHAELTVEDLPDKLRNYRGWDGLPSSPSGELLSLEEVELRYIHHVLDRVGGNKRRAARILGVNRATLYRKLDRAIAAANDDADD